MARPETTIELLRLVRRNYGGVTAYISSIGVTAEEIERLRLSLVE